MCATPVCTLCLSATSVKWFRFETISEPMIAANSCTSSTGKSALRFLLREARTLLLRLSSLTLPHDRSVLKSLGTFYDCVHRS